MPEPMAHQWEAIEEIATREALLVHHGTGSGKTGTAVNAIDVLVRTGDIPILHIVPNSLIEQTIEEYEMWLGHGWAAKNLCVLDAQLSIVRRAEALSGHSRAFTANVYLLSTESLSYKPMREAFRKRQWAATFIDEASRFRNYSARTRTLQVIGQRSQSRYAFTGNVMPRNPADLWYIMNFLVPRIFETSNITTFKSEYCVLGGYTGTQAIGIRPDKVAKLKAILDTHSVYAELSDIRSDMPVRTLAVRRVPMKSGIQTQVYNQMRDELRAWILSLTEAEFKTEASTYSVRLTRLLEIAAGFARNVDQETRLFGSNKTDEMIDILKDSEQPTIIWYWWTPEKRLIETALAKEGISFITFNKAGDGSRDRFMKGDADVYISQLAKGAYGLNLTRATRMIYHSLPWDLDAYLQSQERNMRLTTTADLLEIEHIVVKGSVDEYVRQKLVQKAGISRALTKSDALKMLR